jgi:hypothetical protein
MNESAKALKEQWPHKKNAVTASRKKGDSKGDPGGMVYSDGVFDG